MKRLKSHQTYNTKINVIFKAQESKYTKIKSTEAEIFPWMRKETNLELGRQGGCKIGSESLESELRVRVGEKIVE